MGFALPLAALIAWARSGRQKDEEQDNDGDGDTASPSNNGNGVSDGDDLEGGAKDAEEETTSTKNDAVLRSAATGNGTATATIRGSVAKRRRGSTFLRRTNTMMSENDTLDLERSDTASIAASARVKTRWTPIVSGIICPFSVLLEIPGLTSLWYIKTVGADHRIVETQPNPVILDVALAISMALGGLANVALVIRFLERYCYSTTLVAIACLTLHDIINAICVTIFGVVHRVNDGFTYSSAFWMTVASSAASVVCNITLIVDFLRTEDFRRHGSGLTTQQRQLVISIMVLIGYLAMGALIYDEIMGLTFENALYFVIVSCTSVGFGDIVPSNLAAKILTFFYTSSGIILIAITIAQAREVLVESFAAAYKHRRALIIQKAKERRARKKEAQEFRLKMQREALEKGHTFGGMYGSTFSTSGGGRGGAGNARHSAFPGDADTRWGTSEGKLWLDRLLVRLGIRKSQEEKLRLRRERSLTRSDSISSLDDDGFRALKRRMEAEQQREFRVKLAIAIFLFLTFWIVGAVVFWKSEDWTFFDSLYFCFVFFSTIGYGDFAPKTPSGRAFFIAWALFGIANLTLLFSVLTESWSSKYKSSIEKSKVRRALRKMQGAQIRGPKDIAIMMNIPRPASPAMHITDTMEEADLADKLVQAARGFDEHAKYLMHGKQGDVPTSLRALLDSEHDPERLERIQGEIGLSATAEAHETLVLYSYYQHFDTLIESADQIKEAFRSHQAESDRLREHVTRLQAHIRQQRQLALSLARSDTISSIQEEMLTETAAIGESDFDEDLLSPLGEDGFHGPDRSQEGQLERSGTAPSSGFKAHVFMAEPEEIEMEPTGAETPRPTATSEQIPSKKTGLAMKRTITFQDEV